jgi:hypothetical protein
LKQQQPDCMTIQQATRYDIAQKNGLTPSKMKQAIGAPAKVEAAQRQLDQDPTLLENACLAALSAGWDEDDRLIPDAFVEA